MTSEEARNPQDRWTFGDWMESRVVIRNDNKELEAEVATLRADLAAARDLLNPVCAEETLCGAIRNLQQAYLSEQGNCETVERLLAAARTEVDAAFTAGWEARGDACYPTPSDWELPLALKEHHASHDQQEQST